MAKVRQKQDLKSGLRVQLSRELFAWHSEALCSVPGACEALCSVPGACEALCSVPSTIIST